MKFLISPIKIGQLPLTVKAVSDMAGDGETRRLKVKAEGLEKTSTQSVLIELSGETKKAAYEFQINLPKNIVKDSQFCSVQVIGDLLGPSLNNLNRLITKPYGCGEQNMITLVPNIHALNYLNTIVGSSSGTNKDMIEKFMMDARNNILWGYQNELKYALNDGSFRYFYFKIF